jgi:hypothetical protein
VVSFERWLGLRVLKMGNWLAGGLAGGFCRGRRRWQVYKNSQREGGCGGETDISEFLGGVYIMASRGNFTS